MTLNKTLTEEQASLDRTDCRPGKGDPFRSGKSAADVPTNEAEPAPAGDSDAEEARRRLERMKLNTVKEELRRAELAFLSAKRVLVDAEARDAAQRIAEALRRCNLSIDNVVKGAAVHFAIETLEGVSKFDPNIHLAEFIQIGGKSLMLASQAMASCGVASIEYWGRQLQSLTGKFASLPTTQAG